MTRPLAIVALFAVSLLAGTPGTPRAQMQQPPIPTFQARPAPEQQQGPSGTATPSGPTIAPQFGGAPAGDDDVDQAVGDVTYSMDVCHPGGAYLFPPDSRVVRATVSKLPDDFEQRGDVIDAILVKAAQYAWQTCPIPYVSAFGRETNDFHYNLHEVDIYGPDGALAVAASLGTQGGFGVTGDQPLWSSHHGYYWLGYRDVLAETRAQAAQQAQQQAQADAQAQQEEQAQAAQTQAQQAQAQTDATNRAGFNQFLGSLWTAIKWGAALLFVLWLFGKRQVIARWYYFTFHPHPAGRLIERAIATPASSPADLNNLADALSDVPGGSSTFRKVRLEQAERLYRKLNEASVKRQREIERRAKKSAKQAREEAAHYGMQEALMRAAEALERAKAAAKATQ